MRPAIVALLVSVCAAASSGCVGYRGPARSISPAVVRSEPGWLRANDVPLVMQRGDADCGLAAAAMVVRHHGGDAHGLMTGEPPKGGLSAIAMRSLFRRRGLQSFVVAGELADLEHELAAGRPVVIGTVKRVDRRRGRPHYEVVVAIHPERRQVVTLDPAAGWRQYGYDDLLSEWRPAKRTTVVALPPADAAATAAR